jgi:hypothetical protein
MKPIDKVDQVLTQYETLVKREGREPASMIGLVPNLQTLMERIELVAEKEKVDHEFDYLLDVSSGNIYHKSLQKGEYVVKSAQKPSHTSSRDSRDRSKSDSSTSSEAETYLSRFYSAQNTNGTRADTLSPEPEREETSALKEKLSHQDLLQQGFSKVLNRDDIATGIDGVATCAERTSAAGSKFIQSSDNESDQQLTASTHINIEARIRAAGRERDERRRVPAKRIEGREENVEDSEVE